MNFNRLKMVTGETLHTIPFGAFSMLDFFWTVVVAALNERTSLIFCVIVQNGKLRALLH